jgi:hypothetical protein
MASADIQQDGLLSSGQSWTRDIIVRLTVRSRTGCSIRAKSVDPNNATPDSRVDVARVDDHSASATHDRDAFPALKEWRPQTVDQLGVSVSGGCKFGSCGGRKSDSRQHGLAAG